MKENDRQTLENIGDVAAKSEQFLTTIKTAADSPEASPESSRALIELLAACQRLLNNSPQLAKSVNHIVALDELSETMFGKES